ncbi:hypothetical protein CPB97_010555 [Podila verticillata]|nr:hypothetical protein CPB97_010555 [Podila verticillata]
MLGLGSLYNKFLSARKNHDKKKAFKQATVIFVLGGPGVGKGTQCAQLVQEYGFVHLSAGDLLRQEQSRPGSPFYELISTFIAEGKIVPMEVTVALLENAILEHIQKANQEEEAKEEKTKPEGIHAHIHSLFPRSHKKKVYFLVDGFPRQMDQAMRFEQEVTRCQFILYLEGPEDVMLERLLKRGETSGRADDNLESIKKRFTTFKETSYPVIEVYAKQGKVQTVSCVDGPDVVFENVKKVFNKQLFSNNEERREE